MWNYSNGITRVDVRTEKVSFIASGTDYPISGIAIGGGYVWLSHLTNGTVTRINMQTQAREGDPIAVGPEPWAMAFGNKYLYVVNAGDNTISRLDGPTGQVVKPPLKLEQRLGELEVYDGVIYVGTTDSVIPIDEYSFFVIDEPIPIKAGSSFALGGGSMWVTYPLDNVIRRIDLQTASHTANQSRVSAKALGT